MKNFIKKNWLYILFFLLIIIKHLLTINIPIYIRDNNGADEYLMLSQAESLIKGNYLGTYDYLTLVKGIGFPLFLATAFKIGISYLSLYSIYYSVATLIAMIPLRKIVKSKFLLLLAFVIILFCPATFDNNVQLVYRNMLIIPQSIILVSSIMMMYFNVNKSNLKLTLWTILTSLTWIFMWHTREDTIWSVPLLAVGFITLLICILINKELFKKKIIKILIILIPFISLFGSIQVISYINYKHYGVYTNNQLNKTNYAKAVNLLMKIKPDQDVEHVTITRNALNKAFAVSPTFSELSYVINSDYDNKNPLVLAQEDNGEINEDLITWELIGAARIKGYYESAQKAEDFWGKVYDELSKAIDDNKLETRAILPSRSLKPYPNEEDSAKKLVSSIGELFVKAAKYDCSHTQLYKSEYYDEDLVRRYETITGAYSLRKDKPVLYLSIYAFAKNNNEQLVTSIEDDNGNTIRQYEFVDSVDIYDYYVETYNKNYLNAKKARIMDVFEIDSKYLDSDMHLVIRNNKNKVVLNLNLSKMEYEKSNDNYLFAIDMNYSGIKMLEDQMIGRATRYVRIANKIKKVYSIFGKILLFISLAYYVFITAMVLINIKLKKKGIFEKWLFLSAILGSVTVMLGGLGYVNAFMVNVDGYLSSVNGLLNLFMILAFIFMINDALNKMKDVVEKKNKKKKSTLLDFLEAGLNFDFKTLFWTESDNTFIQFFRYLFVGGIAAVINIGSLYIFVEKIHLFYLVANILSFVLGLTTNYILSKKFVFQAETNINPLVEFGIYAIIGVLGLGIDTLCIWIFTDLVLLYYMLSKILSTMIVFIWNFVIRKLLYKIIGK